MFRLDASPAIGGGHAIRCLALADALSLIGFACHFAVHRESLQFVPVLARHGVIELADKCDDAAALSSAIPDGVSWLVVDHYGISAEFESACRPWASRILAIEDAPNRMHDADLLLDSSPSATTESYASSVSAACRLLLGSRFAPLRAVFAEERSGALARRELGHDMQRILVSLGAGAPLPLVMQTLDLLQAAGAHCDVEVIMGAANADMQAARTACSGLPFPVSLIDFADDIALRMSRADLAVGAGGVTALERCCLGLPSVLVVLAQNQEGIARGLRANGAALVVTSADNLRDDNVVQATRTLLTDAAARVQMSRFASQLCDGRGAERVAALMLEMS